MRSLARFRYDVYQCRFACLDHGNSAPERWTEVVRIVNRAFTVDTKTSRHRSIVYVRRIDVTGNAHATDIPVASLGDYFHLHDFLVIAPIVMHDIQQWNPFVRSRPENTRTHHKIAVPHDADAQSTVFLIG